MVLQKCDVQYSKSPALFFLHRLKLTVRHSVSADSDSDQSINIGKEDRSKLTRNSQVLWIRIRSDLELFDLVKSGSDFFAIIICTVHPILYFSGQYCCFYIQVYVSLEKL